MKLFVPSLPILVAATVPFIAALDELQHFTRAKVIESTFRGGKKSGSKSMNSKKSTSSKKEGPKGGKKAAAPTGAPMNEPCVTSLTLIYTQEFCDSGEDPIDGALCADLGARNPVSGFATIGGANPQSITLNVGEEFDIGPIDAMCLVDVVEITTVTFEGELSQILSFTPSCDFLAEGDTLGAYDF
ncbi:MAG: hypothetical protein SGILL_008800, partial [Bacillariaceae sp.]